MKKTLFFPLKVSLYTVGCFQVSNSIAQAQITPDGTVNTVVTPNGNVSEITGGETRGGNLFHSFQDFSVPTGNEAFFNNANSISNIFSRVTGGNISNINGAIRANGTANLFLINPAGIIFGENARLDIGGSFLGSTASSILFEDGEFNAADLTNPPLLTVNAPIGLGFRAEPGDIVNRAGFQELNNEETIENAGLRVNPGEFITLAGGNINLDNGRLTAPGGRIELAGILTQGTIQLNEDLSLNLAENLIRGDISLNGLAEIDVTFSGGGDINIYGQNINVLGGSDICAGIGADGACGERNENFGSLDAQSGDILFNASDTVTIDGGISDVNNQVNFGGLGNSGNINIETSSLVVSNGGRISTNTSGEGNSGLINIFARERVSISDSEENPTTSIRSNINLDGVGDSGGINVDTNILSVNDGAQIQSFTEGVGNSGKIVINANSVEFSGRDVEDFPSGAFSLVEAGGEGNAGGIDINANSLLMSDRAQFLSNTAGVGNAGNINLQITGETRLLNSSILTEVSEPFEDNPGGFGNGGDLNINTGSLFLLDGSSLLADVENIGNAGNISINTGDLIVEGIGLTAMPGGTRTVPSQISTTVQSGAEGNGGDIKIEASSISIRDSAFVDATTSGNGNAGSIEIIAQEIELENEARILAETAFSEGGNVFLNVEDNLTLRENSLISAEAFNDADGGNITIDANFVIAFPNQTPGNGSDIIASAVDGDGGNISITAESLLGIQAGMALEGNGSNNIDASSDFGLDGTISIFTPDINPVRGVTELPQNIVVPEETTAQACQSDREAVAKSSFVVSGKGGIPAQPGLPLDSQNIITNNETDRTSIAPQPIKTSKGKIQPARGVEVTESGEVILTAYKTNNAGDRLLESERNCDRV